MLFLFIGLFIVRYRSFKILKLQFLYFFFEIFLFKPKLLVLFLDLEIMLEKSLHLLPKEAVLCLELVHNR